MSAEAKPDANVQQAVPFFLVASMEASLKFYVDGLGFRMKHQWIDEGKLRWCWLQVGDAALMLQEWRVGGHGPQRPKGEVGLGVSVCYMCRDALEIYRSAKAKGVEAKRPFVGNRLWVTSFTDPDGYRVEFESPTDAPEESEYDEDGPPAA